MNRQGIFDTNILDIKDEKGAFETKKSVSRINKKPIADKLMNYHDCKREAMQARKMLSRAYGKQSEIQNKLDLARSYLSYRKIEREKDW